MLTAIGNRDYVIVQAGLLLLVTVFIVVNLLAPTSRTGSSTRVFADSAQEGLTAMATASTPIAHRRTSGRADNKRLRHARGPLAAAASRALRNPMGLLRRRGRWPCLVICARSSRR